MQVASKARFVLALPVNKMFRKPKQKGFKSAGAAARKRKAARRRSSSSEDDSPGNAGGGDGEEGTSDLLEQLRHERESKKQTASGPLLNTSSTISKNKKRKGEGNWMHQYKSNDSKISAQDEATRTAEYHPDERTGADNETASGNAQIAGLQKQPRNKFLAGPLKATTFVRTTVRFDYQPDICKDYKETGFCGFGDTCIYLHDRGDTKTGWQLEQEYEEKKKREEMKKSKDMEAFMASMMSGQDVCKPAGDGEASKVDPDDGIPFACHICREEFKNPIVTPCGHYFCERCLLDKIKESGHTGCPICSKDTNGVMNHPLKLVAKKRRLVGREGTWKDYLEMLNRINSSSDE